MFISNIACAEYESVYLSCMQLKNLFSLWCHWMIFNEAAIADIYCLFKGNHISTKVGIYVSVHVNNHISNVYCSVQT